MHDAPRHLLTWSDRGAGPSPVYHRPRPGDTGPVIRLLEEGSARYGSAEVLATPAGEPGAAVLAEELRERITDVRVRILPVSDPSDHAQLFAALEPVVAGAPPDVDVLLSAGTPQAQTLWVILVQAGLLKARMLQVIPSVFVPDPHPHPVREVRLDIEGFPEIRALRAEVARLRAAEAAAVSGLVGESAPVHLLRRRIARVGPADVTAMIQGETGTGKELVARAIHAASTRSSGPFIAENCGALAPGLQESELFGHERGSFTGATGTKRGLFELASGGTLFLDEVGELPPRVQTLLLRVLQEGTIRRVGGEKPIPVDARIVTATHRDLPAMVAAGEFRSDLYYRLCMATLDVPPLRDRGGDLDLLIAHFLRELKRPDLWPTPAAFELLRRHRWPGNVRQLRAEVVRWTVFADGPVAPSDLSPEIIDLPPPLAAHPAPLGVRPLADAVAAVEQRAIAAALEATGGNKARAARLLGIDRNTLKRKIAEATRS